MSHDSLGFSRDVMFHAGESVDTDSSQGMTGVDDESVDQVV